MHIREKREILEKVLNKVQVPAGQLPELEHFKEACYPLWERMVLRRKQYIQNLLEIEGLSDFQKEEIKKMEENENPSLHTAFTWSATPEPSNFWYYLNGKNWKASTNYITKELLDLCISEDHMYQFIKDKGFMVSANGLF